MTRFVFSTKFWASCTTSSNKWGLRPSLTLRELALEIAPQRANTTKEEDFGVSNQFEMKKRRKKNKQIEKKQTKNKQTKKAIVMKWHSFSSYLFNPNLEYTRRNIMLLNHCIVTVNLRITPSAYAVLCYVAVRCRWTLPIYIPLTALALDVVITVTS